MRKEAKEWDTRERDGGRVVELVSLEEVILITSEQELSVV
jgi:hypothetical protein